MINFRYHLVSVVAVFLALGIGVIMGSAVIDGAVVERLEAQQDGLENDVDDVRQENDELSDELDAMREGSARLADEGSERLLADSLTDVPVLLVGVRGAESDGLEDLLSLIETAGADFAGTVWLTERLVADDDGTKAELAGALDLDDALPSAVLRRLALTRLAGALRVAAAEVETDNEVDGEEEANEDEVEDEDGEARATTDEMVPFEEQVVSRLRDGGFIETEGVEGPDLAGLVPGTRILVVSGPSAELDNEIGAIPLVTALVEIDSVLPPAPVLAVEAVEPGEDDEVEETGFVLALREASLLDGRLATVDNIDDFAGRLAAVLAIVDLGENRVGDYGRGDGAERLLPAGPT